MGPNALLRTRTASPGAIALGLIKSTSIANCNAFSQEKAEVPKNFYH